MTIYWILLRLIFISSFQTIMEYLLNLLVLILFAVCSSKYKLLSSIRSSTVRKKKLGNNISSLWFDYASLLIGCIKASLLNLSLYILFLGGCSLQSSWMEKRGSNTNSCELNFLFLLKRSIYFFLIDNIVYLGCYFRDSVG